MVKFSAKVYLMAIISFFIAINDANSFFFLPPGPFSPTLDGAADASGGVEAGGNVISKINEKSQQFQTNVLEKIKSFQENVESKVDEIKGKIDDAVDKVKEKAENLVNNTVNKVKGKLHSKEKGDSVIATSRDIAECEIADIRDEESIVEAFKVLFGEYPAEFLQKHPQDKEGIKKLYKDKAVEFSNDAMVELYIASRDMKDRMDALQQEVDGMSDKYVTGTAVEPNPEVSGETGESNDELGSWVNYYKVAEIYDSILRITEELSALEAQYEAAQALRGGIEPEEPIIEEEVSSNGYFKYDISSTVSYAQASGVNPAIFKKPVVNVQNDNLEIIETKPRVAESPFKGTAAQFESLANTNEIAFILNEAIDAHNTIQQLEGYKGPFVEYNRMKSLHYQVIDKLKVSEDCVMQHMKRYFNNARVSWLGDGCVYGENRNIYCDKGIKITPSVLDGVVEGDHLCVNDKTKLCSDFSLNRYERRGGLSGWLISAYKIAKAEKTLEYGDVEFATQTNDIDVSASTEIGDIDEMGEQGDALASQQNSDVAESSYIRPSDELRVAQNDRERDLLAWQLGALLSQKIGKAMAENDETYGAFKNNFSLWNDEKYFYEKYLEGKYTNMEVFIRSLDTRLVALEIAREINNALYVEEDEEEKEQEGYEGPKMHGELFENVLRYNEQGLDALEKAISQNPTPKIDDVEVAQKKLEKEIEEVKKVFYDTLDAKQQEIDDLYKNIDILSEALNVAKLEYNAAVENKMKADSNIEAEKKVIATAEEKAKKSSKIKIKKQQVQSIKKIASEEKLKLQYEADANRLKNEIENLEEQIDAAKERIDATKEQLVKIKSDYAKSMAEMEYVKELTLEEAYNKIMNVDIMTLMSHVNSTSGTKAAILKNIIKLADTAAEMARENAFASIRRGYLEILELNIFDPEEHDNIVDIHREIMDNIRNPKINITSLGYLAGYINVSPIEAAAVKALSAKIYNQVCYNNICKDIDELYYIAATPNEADFRAPKAIAPSYTPPLREIVHFDNTDFDNLNISDDYHIAKDSLITVGAMLTTSCEGDAKSYFCENKDETNTTSYTEFVPPIWKLILGPKGFVEKDVPIIPLLTKNSQTEKTDYMLKGGIYPCNYENYSIGINNGEFNVAPKGDFPKCANVKSVKISGLNKAKFTTLDGTEIEAIRSQTPVDEETISELGLFANIDEKGWVFNNDLRRVMKYLSEIGDDYDKSEKYKSDSMLFDRNQFGDFLRFVEGEMEYQKSLDELDVKVDNARATLLEAFAKFGFVPEKMDFDLSDEDTFNSIVKQIDSIKNNKIKTATEMLDKISVNNELISENVEKLKNTLSLLETDNREVVSISDSMSLDQLKEAITRADTDKGTQGEYDERIGDFYKDQEENYMMPYCSTY